MFVINKIMFKTFLFVKDMEFLRKTQKPYLILPFITIPLI